MKKDKHITINLTDEEHEKIERIAEEEQRTPASVARLLILEALKNRNNKKVV